MGNCKKQVIECADIPIIWCLCMRLGMKQHSDSLIPLIFHSISLSREHMNSQFTIAFNVCGFIAQSVEHHTVTRRSWVQIPFKP